MAAGIDTGACPSWWKRGALTHRCDRGAHHPGGNHVCRCGRGPVWGDVVAKDRVALAHPDPNDPCARTPR